MGNWKQAWQWAFLLLLQLCRAQRASDMCIDANLHNICAVDDGKNYVGNDIVVSNHSTPCLPGEHCRFYSAFELGVMAERMLRGMVACPVASLPAPGLYKYEKCNIPLCLHLPLCNASLQVSHLPARNGSVQVMTPYEMVSALRDPLVAEIIMMNDIVLTASDFEAIPVFIKDHRALTIRSNSGLEQLVYDRPFDSGFFDHNWVVLGDGGALYVHNFCTTKAFDLFSREIVFFELEANSSMYIINSSISWMCQDGAEYLVGSLFEHVDQNSPAVKTEDPQGVHVVNTSLTVMNDDGNLRFVSTNIVCHKSSMMHDDTLEFCKLRVPTPAIELPNETSPLGSEAESESPPADSESNLYIIFAMASVAVLWLACGGALVIRRYHREGARAREGAHSQRNAAADLEGDAPKAENVEDPVEDPAPTTPAPNAQAQLRSHYFSRCESQIAGLQKLAKISFFKELDEGGGAVATEAIEHITRTLEAYQQRLANGVFTVSANFMDDSSNTLDLERRSKPDFFFTALRGSFTDKEDQGDASQLPAETFGTAGTISSTDTNNHQHCVVIPEDIIRKSLERHSPMECEQMLHDLSSTHKAPITEWHSYDMEAASILNIENEQRLEEMQDPVGIESTKLSMLNSGSRSQAVLPMPAVGAVLHGSTGSAYELLSVIGRGSFGVVYAARDVATKRLQAVKVGLNTSMDEKNNLYLNEARMLSMVHCPQVIALRESFVFENRFCIVTEYCALGSLWEMIQSVKKEGSTVGLEESVVMSVLVDMCKALASLHSIDLIHRDVKAENVLVTNHGSFKLADFGTCRVLHNTSTTFAGTPLYMAPEVIRRHPYSQPSDMWSLGHLLYECCTFEQLFDTNCMESLLEKHDHPYKPLDSFKYSKHLVHVISVLLTPEPEKRPTAMEVLKMPYVQWVIRQLCASKERLLRDLTKSKTNSKIAME